MATFYFDFYNIQKLLLIFIRVSAIIISIPVLNSKNIPTLFKVGMIFSITFMLLPVVEIEYNLTELSLISLFINIAIELLFGICIGLTINLVFAAIQLAGQLAGYQMGFAIANVIDPQSGAQSSIFSGLQNIFALLIFVSLNAHHYFIKAIVDSFKTAPVFHLHVNGHLFDYIIKMAGEMFVISVKVAAPVMAALLLTSISLGLVARTVPRMNVFLVAMPLKIVLGMIFISFSLPYLSCYLKDIFDNLGECVMQICNIFSKP